ncbi:MAG: hypothetical protein J07HQX50_01784 [Haloquadratum sp. J07HQX50]|nr:MAG: hypothetical protein J07HQX50_01784 [Haloquadratum sp. J07HQX50]
MTNIPQNATDLWNRLIDDDVYRGEQTDAVKQLTEHFEQYPEIDPEQWLVTYERQYPEESPARQHSRFNGPRTRRPE